MKAMKVLFKQLNWDTVAITVMLSMTTILFSCIIYAFLTSLHLQPIPAGLMSVLAPVSLLFGLHGEEKSRQWNELKRRYMDSGSYLLRASSEPQLQVAGHLLRPSSEQDVVTAGDTLLRQSRRPLGNEELLAKQDASEKEKMAEVVSLLMEMQKEAPLGWKQIPQKAFEQDVMQLTQTEVQDCLEQLQQIQLGG